MAFPRSSARRLGGGSPQACGGKEASKLARAPTLVLATAVLSGDPRTDEEDLHAAACAVYAVLLGATERGLASYWRTPAAFGTDEAREVLALGDDERLVGADPPGAGGQRAAGEGPFPARRRAQRSAVASGRGADSEKQRRVESPGSSNFSSTSPLSSSALRKDASGRWLMPTRDRIPVGEKFLDSVCQPVRRYSG